MKRILNTILFLFAALTMVAQNSFVVADKNGNSQLVQSLIFQQQQDADRFTWKADGSNTGNIKDLLFIARAKAELATANADDVTQILEESSGTNWVSADAFAAALESNSSVEEVYSADDNNLVVKLKNGGGRVIYPMYEEQPLFSDDIANFSKELMMRKTFVNKAASFPNGTVALFSTLKNNTQKYAGQIKLVECIKNMLTECGYMVEPYECSNFTVKKYEDVIKNSASYRAIIVMSHGALIERSTMTHSEKGVLVSGEECDKDDAADKCWIEDEGKYYKTISNELNTSANCLIYLGACYGACWGNKYGTNPFSSINTAVIGWMGVNSIAQAHAAMLFYRLLYMGKTVNEALGLSFLEDPTYGTIRYSSPRVSSFGKMNSNADVQPKYHDNLSFKLYRDEDIAVKKKDGIDRFCVTGRIYGKWPDNVTRRVEFLMKSLFSNTRISVHLSEDARIYKDYDQDAYFFSLIIPFDEPLSEGVYQIEIEPYGTGKTIKPQNPFYIVYSRNFGDNCALPELPEEDVYTPTILDSSAQTVTEITLTAGSSKTFEVDAYSGHELTTLSLNTDVATVSLNGTTLTVNGVSEGSTLFGVCDRQNRQMAAVRVTVTAGGGGDVVAYTSCPDDNHPHLIDLGLPSGTKWACCNVGATKPEGRGGYYAWGETEEKRTYDWSTYIHCDGSEDTFHNIGTDIAGSDYDVAHVKWGGSWVMPNLDQVKELLDNCESEWTTENDMKGRRFTASNGASIFLPAADCRSGEGVGIVGTFGYYWSSTFYESLPDRAYDLEFASGYIKYYCLNRINGFTVRPVWNN